MVNVTLKQTGMAAGSLVSIAAFLTIVMPVLRSDAPPWAGAAKADEAKVSIRTLEQRMNASEKTMLFLQQGFWQREFILANEEITKQPGSASAQLQLLNAKQQLDRIKVELAK